MSTYCGIGCPHLNDRKNYCEKWKCKLLFVKWSFRPIHKDPSKKVIVVKTKGEAHQRCDECRDALRQKEEDDHDRSGTT